MQILILNLTRQNQSYSYKGERNHLALHILNKYNYHKNKNEFASIDSCFPKFKYFFKIYAKLKLIN